jgi:hypothetical protein
MYLALLGAWEHYIDNMRDSLVGVCIVSLTLRLESNVLWVIGGVYTGIIKGRQRCRHPVIYLYHLDVISITAGFKAFGSL